MTRTRKQREQTTIRKQFIAKGCSGAFLDELLKDFRRHCDESETEHRKRESTSTIQKLEVLHRRLNAIASEIERLREKPLVHLLCGRSLRQVIGLFDTTSIRAEADNLKKTSEKISHLTVRNDVQAAAIKKIYDYCDWATNGATTKSEVADLLNEAAIDISDPDKPVSDDAVRKAVKRQTTTRKDEFAKKLNLVGAAMRKDTVRDFTLRKLRSSDANEP
jgi:hypothetical protein